MTYKTILAAACVSLASAALAIESANIVGYQTKPVDAGKYQMLALQFNDVVAGKVDFAKVVGMPDIAAHEWGNSACARIMTLRDDGGYDFFYYINDATDANDEALDGNMWTDQDGYQLTEDNLVNVGTGAWFYSLEAGNICLSGSVNKDGGAIKFAPKAYTMQSSPVPAALDLNSVTTSGLIACEWGNSACARIMTLRDDGGYDFFYYINDATDANDEALEGDMWTDQDGYQLTAPIAGVGEAFWCFGQTEGSLGIAL